MNVFTCSAHLVRQLPMFSIPPHTRLHSTHVVDDLLRRQTPVSKLALRPRVPLRLNQNAHNITPPLTNAPALKQAHRQLRRDLANAPARADRLERELREQQRDERHRAHHEHRDEPAKAEPRVHVPAPRRVDLFRLGALARFEVVPERDAADDVEPGDAHARARGREGARGVDRVSSGVQRRQGGSGGLTCMWRRTR